MNSLAEFLYIFFVSSHWRN